MTTDTVQALQAVTVTDVETAADALGIGRTLAYLLAKSGQLADGVPCIRVGAKYVVPTRPLLAALGYDPITEE